MKDDKKKVAVSFQATDLKKFNTEKTTLIKSHLDDANEESKILKSLFVTQAQDAIDEFE